jgi:hypothetical protein
LKEKELTVNSFQLPTGFYKRTDAGLLLLSKYIVTESRRFPFLFFSIQQQKKRQGVGGIRFNLTDFVDPKC